MPRPAVAVPEECAAAPDEFEEFVAGAEPGLRRALVAGFGPEVGRDAAADALVWAWRNWERVRRFSNPGGYLYRVGQSSARRQLRNNRRAVDSVSLVSNERAEDSTFEPGLTGALEQLSVRQRAAVMLVHGYSFTLREAALAMGCSPSSVRNHVSRALMRLRHSIGAPDEA